MACEFWTNLVKAKCEQGELPGLSGIYGTGWAEGGELGGELNTTYGFREVGPGSLLGELTSGSTVFINVNGVLHALGYNDQGQAGVNSSSDNIIVPTSVLAGEAYATASWYHSLLLVGTSLYGCGEKYYLGIDQSGRQQTPRLLTSGVTLVSAGNTGHSIYLASGVLYGIGPNSNDQLGGLGGYTVAKTPKLITGISGTVTGIACSNRRSLVLAGGEIYGSGYNPSGQLGFETPSQNNTVPNAGEFTLAPSGSGATAIAAGYEHAMCLKGTTLYATGSNSKGQLGLGDTNTRLEFTEVATGVSSMACGHRTSAYIKDGDLYTFGDDSFGELGLGGLGTVMTPTKVDLGGSKVKAVVCTSDVTLIEFL